MTTVVEHDTREQTPRPSRMPAVRTFLVTLLLIGGAAAGGSYVVGHRLADSAFRTLDEAVLTADALPVGSTGPGVVIEVLVTEQSRVAVGQELARVRVADPQAPDRQTVIETLRAPKAATVSKIDIPLGGVVGAGEPVVTLYDHTSLSFHTKASEKELRDLRLGMTARITGPGLDRPVSAALDHVEPRVGADPLADAPLTEEQKADHEQLTLVLLPRIGDVDTVSALVPGLQFTADIDTETAVGRTPAVNSAG